MRHDLRLLFGLRDAMQQHLKQRGYRLSDQAVSIIDALAESQDISSSEALERLLLSRVMPRRQAAEMAKVGREIGRPRKGRK